MMNKSIKCIAIDLDGTLLKQNLTVSQENLEALELCYKNDIVVVPVTGRSVLRISELISTENFPYIIGSNGGLTLSKSGELVSHPLSIEKTLEILNIFLKYDGILTISNKGIYTRLSTHDLLSDKLKMENFINHVIKEEMRADKMTLKTNTLSEMEKLQSEIMNIKGINYYRTEKLYLEVTCIGISKGITLLEVLRLLNIDPLNTMAIGDGSNDISMFQVVGYSCAMGNASLEVKQHANRVVASNEDNGVAEAIKLIFNEN